MKKTIFYAVLLIFCYNELAAQGKNHISTEIDVNYYHYLLGNAQNRFNYGFSLLASAYIAKIKVSSGINWSKLDYYYTDEPSSANNFFEKRDYRLKYLNFPIFVAIRIKPSQKLTVGILNGFVLNYLYSYHINSYYLTKEPVIEKDIRVSTGGFSFRTGAELSKAIAEHLVINFLPFINIKLSSDPGGQPDYRTIDDRGVSFGMNLGIEYLFFNN